jgi:hypothetical protein
LGCNEITSKEAKQWNQTSRFILLKPETAST